MMNACSGHVVIVHGGAGIYSPKSLPKIRDALLRALEGHTEELFRSDQKAVVTVLSALEVCLPV